LAAGADDYIVKPFNTRDFTTRVNAVLARVQANGARPSEFARSNPDPPDLVPPNVTPPALVQPNLAPPALVQPNLAPPDQASPSGGG
jgi:DNA-binding response OmpR family regulator